MPVTVNPPGAESVWDVAELKLPVDGAAYIGWMGGPAANPSLLRCRRNLKAARQPLLDKVGTPTSSAVGLITMSSDAYLTLPLVETANATLIVAFRSTGNQSSSITRAAPIGWAIDEGGLSIYAGGPTLLRASANFMVSGTPTQRTASLTMPNGWQNSPRIVAAVSKVGTGVTLYDLTAGTSIVDAETAPRVLSASQTLRVGAVAGGNAGPSTLYAAAAFSFALTAAQLDSIKDAMAARLSALNGLTV